MYKLAGCARHLPMAGVLAVSLAIAAPTTVRGRLDQYNRAGLGPAAFVQVTLEANGREIASAVTGSDGMYYFRNVTPGTCTLRIWLQEEGDTSRLGLMEYEVEASRRPYTDIGAILVNRVDFNPPEGGYACTAGAKLSFEGTHTLPSGAPVALAFRTAHGTYVRLRPTLELVAGSTWRFADVPVPAGTDEVLAVLFADEPRVKVRPPSDKSLGLMVQSFRPQQVTEPGQRTEQSFDGQVVLDALPNDATVVGSRKINVQ